ncbi:MULTISPECIES: PH domain-containing protein [Streptomycetaceae]|uniref:PH domain-containing protein n=1 Tax=Streptomycetaceae TaxID=2062 RepID=UPI00036AF2C1|nr:MULTISPECIES: PH domain-containing protein [unclassified Streptomyces]MYX35323.1 PH domain-containing protein [Streptomyces sp. SID8377]
MTSSENPAPEPQPDPGQPKYAERAYRSAAGVAGGVIMLAVTLWLGIDAIVRGTGNTPWLALALMLLIVPLVVAFTLRPVVRAGDDRLLVRNPFRTVTASWGAVEGLRSGYSTELFVEGKKYQLWAVPVSMRARKRAARARTRAAAAGDPGATLGARPGAPDTTRAWSDRVVDELRELAERHGAREGAPSEVTVRWAYEVIAPAVAGAVVLIVLMAIG